VDIRAIIVDDEKPAREEIKEILKRFDDINILREFDNAIDAFNFVSKSEIDVIFLDINLPGISGIKLAMQLKEFKNFPLVVFVTAYAEFAVDAFEVGAVDYILKPVEEARITKTVAKIRNLLLSKESEKDQFVVCIEMKSLYCLN